jgi:hypothetical protein
MTAVQAGPDHSVPGAAASSGQVPGDPLLGDPVLDELVERLHRSTGMARGVAARVIDEVIAGLAEPLEDFVRRRHRELQARGERNERIYARIVAELARRPVRVAPLSERQIRRLVYG